MVKNRERVLWCSPERINNDRGRMVVVHVRELDLIPGYDRARVIPAVILYDVKRLPVAAFWAPENSRVLTLPFASVMDNCLKKIRSFCPVMRNVRLPFGLSMYPVPSTEPSSDPVQFPVRSGFVVAAGVVVPGEVQPE